MDNYLKSLGYDPKFIQKDYSNLDDKINKIKDNYGIIIISGFEHIPKTTYFLSEILRDSRLSILKIGLNQITNYMMEYGIDSNTLRFVKAIVIDKVQERLSDKDGLLNLIDLIIKNEKLLVLSSAYSIKELINFWDESISSVIWSYYLMEL